MDIQVEKPNSKWRGLSSRFKWRIFDSFENKHDSFIWSAALLSVHCSKMKINVNEFFGSIRWSEYGIVARLIHMAYVYSANYIGSHCFRGLVNT